LQNKIREKIFTMTHILEILVSIIVIIAIIISFTSIPEQMYILYENRGNREALRIFLAYIFNIVICLEFLRMLSKHTFNSLIEVLIFAIARELIVEKTTTIENLVAIIGMAILFFIRKYMLIKMPEE